MTDVVTDYTALLTGDYWGGIEVLNEPTIVTYSFPTSAPAYDSTVSGFASTTAGTFKAFSADEQAQAREALGEWAAASGLVFIEVAPGQGDINFQNVDFKNTSYNGAGGIAFYPFGEWDSFSSPSFRSDLDASGDVFMNTELMTGDTVNYGTLLHEIGHAIGLKHPTETVYSPFMEHDQVLASDDPSLTIMSTVGDTSSASNADHLKQLDMDAVSHIYGAAGTGGVYTTSASGTNSTSAWSWNADTQTLTQNGTSADDTIRGSSVSDVIYGNGGTDHLFGLNGNDTLVGGTGNDQLDGGPGADKLVGGGGQDTYYVDNTGDVIDDTGGTGSVVNATINYTLPDALHILYLYHDGLTGTGNAGNDQLYNFGNGGALYGMAGNDILDGNGVLDGGTGADTYYGGAGNDTYYIDNPGDVIANTGGGTDTVDSSISFSLANLAIDTLQLIGTANINATGNADANMLIGNSGNNVLDGGTGADTMTGGLGDDTYYVDNVGDKVIEANNGGNDIVYSSVSYGLAGQFIETLTLTGTANINATGNGQNNTLNGNSGNNVLDGGAGADTMAGGAGDDTYYVDNVGDHVIEANNGGNDTVYSSVSFSLAGQFIETLALTGTANINATGNGQANTLIGNAGNNVITTGTGADIVVYSNATFGADTITDFTAGSASGHDVIQFASSVFSSYAAVTAHAAQVGSDVVITYDAHDTIDLQHVTLASLTASDFAFV